MLVTVEQGSTQPYSLPESLTRNLNEQIQSIFRTMSEKSSTIECLLNGLRTEEDLDEVHAKLLEAAHDIERLIPLLKYYLAQEEPRDELAKNRFWLERERINRDLEESLRNFSMISIVLETSQTAKAKLEAPVVSEKPVEIQATPKRIVIQDKNVKESSKGKPTGVSQYQHFIRMGVNVSRGSPNERQTSRRIDVMLQEEKMTNNNIVKLLLLGAAGGGKTTILKQLRILHQDRFEESELRQHRRVIHSNIVKMAIEILKYLVQHNQELSKVSAMACIDILQKVDHNKSEFSIDADLATLLLALRADAVFRHCYVQAIEHSFMVSTKYYFDNLDRICSPEYTPNDQDILRNRVSTTGVVELRLNIQDRPFRIYDVGGQRTERRKWIHCFSDVNSVIFITSLAEYNMVLEEDEKTNRMVESITLFKSLCHSRWFVNVPMILFLNMRDVFEEKIALFPITVAFKDYTGPFDRDSSLRFIEKEFQKQKPIETGFYVHQTCATNTENVQFVFEACMDIILASRLKDAGLI